VALLPEVSVLRVRTGAARERDLVYTLVHNAAHTNVAFLFGDDDRRLPADDTVTVVRGHFGSYPNFFFDVAYEQIDAFTDELRGLANESDLERFATRFGVRRTDPRFWAMSDWLRESLRRASPGDAGVYDLARYENL
jgi:hypothetical protein